MNEWDRRSRFVSINKKAYQRTEYTNFILQYGQEERFDRSGLSSPKNFVMGWCADLWTAHQVIKRMEKDNENIAF